MIYDTVENMPFYFEKDEKLKKVLECYKEFAKEPFEEGRIDIIPDKIWCNVSKYNTKSSDGAKFESHRKFLDVQLMFEGEENIGWAPVAECKITDDFKEGGDIAFMTCDNGQFFCLKKGYFAVFFPGDAHMPCINSGNCDFAHKLVFKVEL